MKILQIVPYFPPAYAFGGPVTVAFQVSKELVKRGHEVVVYTSDAKDLVSRLSVEPVSYVDGIKVNYFRNIPISKLKLFLTPELVSKVKEEVKQFDVIHLHEFRTFQNIIVHFYAMKYRVPYVLQAHGSLPRFTYLKWLKWIYDKFFGYGLLRDASKVIALNQAEAEQYQSMGVRDETIEIIPNGIDLTEYSDLPLRGSFKEKYNIPLETTLILYLGRIHKIKGINILVKAFAKIIEKVDNVKLVIVGPDDGYLEEIQVLINNLAIEKNILITGPLYGKEKLEAYVDADVYVLPSRYETFPMSVLEAYSCGKPVIASRVGGLKDLVIDGVTGLLFESENNEQLVESLLSLLNNDARAEKMGAKGNEFVEENFTIEKMVDRLEDIYTEAVIT